MRRTTAIAAVLVCTTGLTAGCAENVGGDFDNVSVPEGASREDYVAAFASVEPITVTFQSASTPGTLESQPFEAYADVLTDWSGGKLDVEVVYSSAIAPAAEIGDALADGRIDFSRHAPLYDPAEFPENNAFVDLTFTGEHSPVAGRLQRFGAFVQSTRESEEIMSELSDHGLFPVFPVWPVTPMVVMACTGEAPATSLDDFEGLTARASGSIHTRQLEALGVTPVDLDVTEIYEGLQRGLIDCGQMSLNALVLTGTAEQATQISYGVSTGFADTPGAYSFGTTFWESLPLQAQQLLWDKLPVFVSTSLGAEVQKEVDALTSLDELDGNVAEWDDDVLDELDDFNTSVLDGASADRPELVAALDTHLDEWMDVVRGDLGIDDLGQFGDLPAWYEPEVLRLDDYMGVFAARVLASGRPA